MNKLQQHLKDISEFDEFKEDFFGLHISGCGLLDRDGSQEKCKHIKDDLENRIKSFIKARDLKTLEMVIGEMGAKLLAKHSPQVVLDAYFDAANEVLEQYETNN